MHSRVVCESAVQHHAHVNLSTFLYLLPPSTSFSSSPPAHSPTPSYIPFFTPPLSQSLYTYESHNVTQHGNLPGVGVGVGGPVGTLEGTGVGSGIELDCGPYSRSCS